MGLDGGFGHAQVVGDLLVEAAGAQHLQHLELLRGEIAQALRGFLFVAAGGRRIVRFIGHPTFAIKHGADGLADGVRICRLGNEAQRTVVQRATHHRRFLARRHDDHRQLRMQRAQVHQRVEAVRTGHVEVHQQQVGVGMGIDQGIQRIHAVGLMQLHPRHHALHGAAQGFAEQRVVVGDQQGRHGKNRERETGNGQWR